MLRAPGLLTSLSLLSLVACSKPSATGDAQKSKPAAEAAPSTSKDAGEDAGQAAAPPAMPGDVPAVKLADTKLIASKLAQFAPVPLEAEMGHLSEGDRKALAELIEAAKLLDPVFDRQAWALGPAFRARLAADTSPEGKAALALYEVMRGPWDRQDHFSPFAVATPRPRGAGYYPEDLTKQDLDAYLSAHEDQRAALEGLFTVVVRDKDALKGVPYSEAYAQWLEPAAKHMETAAGLTSNESLATFLRSRAAAFLSLIHI